MKKLLVTMLMFLVIIFAQTDPLATIENSVETDFATYEPYTIDIIPNALQYEIKSDFSNISNFSSFNFTDSEKEKLLENYFVVTDRIDEDDYGYKDIYDIYNEARDTNIPQFITSDAVLHVFHKMFDKVLKNSETKYFFSRLEQLEQALYTEALNHYAENDDVFIKNCFKTVASYFAVSLSLLDDDFVPSPIVADTVQLELDLISASAGYANTPLFNNAYSEDYSQYKPRGHYTDSDSLEHYFQAMMWHGRQTFVLYDANGIKRARLTGAALALVYLMETSQVDTELWKCWNDIYLPTTFFVGKADDLLMQDYLLFVEQEYFNKALSDMSLSEFLNIDTISNFIEAADQYMPLPSITTLTPKGMRFMGQRFTPDNKILVNMVDQYRTMPKSLDIPAVLHSEEAYNILEEIGETDIDGYVGNLNYLKNIFESYPDEQWAENLYWNWIYCLMPLLTEKGSGFPPFMQNVAWLRKDINTALGSWTELRHDTILYSKQGAYPIGYMPGSVLAKGYVEPNPWLFARLASLTKFMETGLQNFDIDDAYSSNKLSTFTELMVNYKNIAVKELTQAEISLSDYEKICLFGVTVAGLTEEDYYNEYTDPENKDGMPVIADVYTDPMGVCLEEGVGYPNRMFVVVPCDTSLQIAVGGVFSYYEFKQSISNRLNDEEWIDILRSEEKPNYPNWVKNYSVIDNTCSAFSHHSVDTDRISYSSVSPIEGAKEFQLQQNYPNPFNPTTSIQFFIPQQLKVELIIYDIMGKKVKTLADNNFSAGTYNITWDGTNDKGMAVSSGIYLYQIKAGNNVVVKKMSFMK